MAAVTGAKGHVYRLPIAAGKAVPSAAGGVMWSHALPETVLVANAFWFCRLRWTVITFLALFGVVQWLCPSYFQRVGLVTYVRWPFIVGAVLACANVLFLLHARYLHAAANVSGARANLWAQIIVDLLVLTYVVHVVGSLETVIPFAYLIHIVLSCIFFSRIESFIATALACIAYLACVLAELTGVVGASGILVDTSVRAALTATPWLGALKVASAVTIWLVVWYLAARLSTLIRDRDYKLTETNERLRAAQIEKAQHMLRTTHELKAPFAAIHANADLLLKGYCGELPEQARGVVGQIARRSRRLASAIQDMLQLAKLRSTSESPPVWTRFNLDDALRWCMAQVDATAREFEVRICAELAPVAVTAVEDHMRLLFTNLLSNAVLYSHPNGQVRVRCESISGDTALVVIEDDGIGIPEEKLPHIFEEYYRTDEAVRHNAGSTGLGLAIVRHVAETHGIEIAVESEPNVGTTFHVQIPTQPRGNAARGGRGGTP